MLAVAGHPHVRSKISLSLSCFAGSPNPSAARHACVRARHVFKALSTAVAPLVCCRTAVPHVVFARSRPLHIQAG